MDEQQPILQGPEQLVGVAAAAFDLLLRGGRPVGAADIAGLAGLTVEETEVALREAAEDSRLRRLADGRVHGVLGLDVLPTGHRVRLDGLGLRYTWCALDVLGIIGALGAGGEATSTSPWTGETIHLRFAGGDFAGGDDAVLFLAERPGDARPADWCPSVNFFRDDADARAWGEAFGVAGRVVDLGEGLAIAAPRWRQVLGR